MPSGPQRVIEKNSSKRKDSTQNVDSIKTKKMKFVDKDVSTKTSIQNDVKIIDVICISDDDEKESSAPQTSCRKNPNVTQPHTKVVQNDLNVQVPKKNLIH